MKKLAIIFTILTLIGLSGCKQDWVCQCVTDNNTQVTNIPINGGTFIHAQHECNDQAGKCSLITEAR